MYSLVVLLQRNLHHAKCGKQMRLYSTHTSPAGKDIVDDDFRVLNLRATKQRPIKKEYRKPDVLPPRTLKMPTDQDWTAVWPGPRSFHPSSVPLTVRQGFSKKDAAPPSKYANAELMKIPNFLHLTPPAIKQQCEALKQFCTPWPKGLNTEEKWKLYFPVDVISTDFCQAVPTIRNLEGRRVILTVKLSELQFDVHAKDKFLRLVGDRYNNETDILTIVADRCPLRKQNYEYALYLLTACYHESFICETWEGTKSEADMEYYKYKNNKSKKTVESILNWNKESGYEKLQASEEFVKRVEQLVNEGENEYNLNKYKEEVILMLHGKKNNS